MSIVINKAIKEEATLYEEEQAEYRNGGKDFDFKDVDDLPKVGHICENKHGRFKITRVDLSAYIEWEKVKKIRNIEK